MAVEVTLRAIEVLRRALEAGRMDPATVGIRIWLTQGPRGDEARTGFAEEPEADETLVEIGGIRLFVPAALTGRTTVVDVADEHDRIVVR